MLLLAFSAVQIGRRVFLLSQPGINEAASGIFCCSNWPKGVSGISTCTSRISMLLRAGLSTCTSRISLLLLAFPLFNGPHCNAASCVLIRPTLPAPAVSLFLLYSKHRKAANPARWDGGESVLYFDYDGGFMYREQHRGPGRCYRAKKSTLDMTIIC
jgi:hypothetical protein